MKYRTGISNRPDKKGRKYVEFKIDFQSIKSIKKAQKFTSELKHKGWEREGELRPMQNIFLYFEPLKS